MKNFLNIFSLFIMGVAYSQTTTENYIQTKIYLEPVTSSSSTAKQIQTVEYFDGLGRPKQIINVKGTPDGNDLVTPIIYDIYGIQTKSYLPIPKSSTSTGNIYPQDQNSLGFPIDDNTNFYQGEKIYSETVFEVSPLNRIQQKKQVGNAWASNPVNFKYETNTLNDAVKRFNVLSSWDSTNGIFSNSLPTFQQYQAGQLYKSSVKDEDGNETIIFKNKEGQNILTRKVLSSTQNADTYYIYNVYNQLVFVIPPLASEAPALDQNIIKHLCYQYSYDKKNRLVEKKLPGKDKEYMVYDRADRLILVQDSNLRTNGEWLFTKYDQFSRPIYTGILYSPLGRVAQANVIEGIVSNIETRSLSSWNNSGVDVFYTNSTSYPTTNFKLLSVNYYDTYPQGYNFNPPFPSSIQGETVLTDTYSIEGKSTNMYPVMNLVKNLEDDNWTKTYNYYDNRGRNISSHAINHLNGYTITEAKLDFVGNTQKNITKHKRLSSDSELVIIEDFEYDNQNRLTKHWHQIDNNPKELLVEKTYNPVYQLINKKVGNNLESIDYTYNIRGWMTKINNPLSLGIKLFGLEIKYENPADPLKAKFNGNISEVNWKKPADGILKRYSYDYDAFDRILNAVYTEPDQFLPQNNFFNEYLTYDINGNIKTLQRFSKPALGSNTAVKIDDLIYNYDNNNYSNRLNKITLPPNVTNNPSGYDALEQLFDYDDNGNMTKNEDKKINIAYNILDLPNSISIKPGTKYANSVLHLYRADGVKLSKTSTTSISSATTEYFDKFQYNFYSGTIVPVIPSGIRFVQTDEGYYDYVDNRYVYNYLDQIGNIRVSYTRGTGNDPEIIQSTDYYPFGLQHVNSLTLNNYYKYSFQGQELQNETGWYSFKWRNYDPAMGRFFNIDPLSDSYTYQSPYNFSENRVIDGIELEGLEFFPFEILLENTGIKPIGPIMEPIIEPKIPFEYAVDPPMEAVPNNIEAVEVTKYMPREFEPAGLETQDYKIENSLDELFEQRKLSPAEEAIIGEETKYIRGDYSRYQDITGTKNAKSNRETNITKEEFENNLEESGFQKTGITKGINRYSKGDKSYTTRNESKESRPTADFRENADGKGPVNIKIRLNE